MSAAAKSAPGGYTLLTASNTLASYEACWSAFCGPLRYAAARLLRANGRVDFKSKHKTPFILTRPKAVSKDPLQGKRPLAGNNSIYDGHDLFRYEACDNRL